MQYYFWYFINCLTYPIRALFYTPGRLFASGARLFGVSLPARMSLLVALFLVICVVISFLAFYFATGRPFPEAKFRPYYLVGVTILVVVIPFVVYHVIRLWMEGEVSRFEDIRKAWNAGVMELEKQGLSLSQTPLFLVLGSHGETQEKSLFDASRVSFNMREYPVGPSALHWYANPDAIYLVCTTVGCLSRLAAIAKAEAEAEKARPARAPGPGPGPAARRAPADLRGTIVTAPKDPMEDSGVMELQDAPTPPPSSMWPESINPAGGPDIRGTMMSAPDPDRPLTAGLPASAGSGQAVLLPQDEAIEQEHRLEYLFTLLRRTRQPLCPCNGILTLLPFTMIQRGQREAVSVQQAAARDLATFTRVCKLRCPVTAMIVGMEEQSGFRELVRRVGRDRASLQRFGKGFSVSNPPIPERLAPLTAHACGSFEDWVYTLFREKGSLAKPGNTKLYALLCKIRHDVQDRLENILVTAYGSDPDHDPQGEPLFFSGCYFAAVGETEDRQAFVKGVLDKLPQEQAELQWNTTARREDQSRQHAAQLVFVLDFVLLVSAIGMFVFKMMWK